jgi:hypothetical protein
LGFLFLIVCDLKNNTIFAALNLEQQARTLPKNKKDYEK